jgi:two-component system KDP operon response regulator KdpE
MLRASLQGSGYQVLLASNGVEGLQQFESAHPDLIITDLAMPEMNGLELTKIVRRVSQTPIIVLSVRDSDAMKVNALDEGADDYLTKPFSTPELLARVRAQPHIEIGDFVIDCDTHTVSVRGEVVHLTPKEFDLLLLFARSPNRVLTHKILLRGIWGPSGAGQPEYLRVLVAGLRKKVELESGHKYIVSEPWVGYRFQPAPDLGE